MPPDAPCQAARRLTLNGSPPKGAALPARPTPVRHRHDSGDTMQPTQRRLANAIRALAMDAVEAANSGHPGMPMGMADAATALFTKVMKYDPADPKWPDRDRFVLSAGHGSMLIYALLHLTGHARPTLDDIKNFRKLNYRTPG